MFLFIAPSSAETELSLPTDIKPFFVHRTVEDAWGRKAHDGIYCYAIERKGVVGPFVNIYIVKHDKVTEMISQGSNGKQLMERIREIELMPFNYKDEVETTTNRLTEEYRRKGQDYYPPMVFDGHSYEIIYELDDTKLKIHAANPGYRIYALAEHSKNIGKLYAVYRELMLYYAERKFHFK